MECMDRCMAIYVPILKHMNTLAYNYPFCHIHIKNTSWQQPTNSPAASCKERHGRTSGARRRGSGQWWKRRSRRFTCELFLAVDATRFHTKNCSKFAFQNCLKFAYFCFVLFCFCFCLFSSFLKKHQQLDKIRDPTIQVRHQVLGAAWAVVKWSKLGSWGPSKTCWRRWVEPLGEDWALLECQSQYWFVISISFDANTKWNIFELMDSWFSWFIDKFCSNVNIQLSLSELRMQVQTSEEPRVRANLHQSLTWKWLWDA